MFIQDQDRKASRSFTRRGSMVYTKTPTREALFKRVRQCLIFIHGRFAVLSNFESVLLMYDFSICGIVVVFMNSSHNGGLNMKNCRTKLFPSEAWIP